MSVLVDSVQFPQLKYLPSHLETSSPERGYGHITTEDTATGCEEPLGGICDLLLSKLRFKNISADPLLRQNKTFNIPKHFIQGMHS